MQLVTRMSVANEKLFSCTHNQRSTSHGTFLILAS